jgi:hypothetical protein
VALLEEAWNDLRRYIYDKTPERREKSIGRFQAKLAALSTPTEATAVEDEREACAKIAIARARKAKIAMDRSFYSVAGQLERARFHEAEQIATAIRARTPREG